MLRIGNEYRRIMEMGRGGSSGTLIALRPRMNKPAVPRPSVRRARAPLAAVKDYASEPPVIRERSAMLELADDDLVEEAPRSTPPPPPSSRIVPKPIVMLAMPPVPVEEPATLAAPMFEAPLATLPPPAPLPVIEAPRADAPAPPLAAPRKLESFVEPTEVLFEGMWELEGVSSAWQAASICASALGRALGARAVLVHTHDLASRELRAVGVHGDDAFDVLGSSDLSDDDLVASAAICNQKPVTMRFDGELPRIAPRRLEILGAPRILVAVPALSWGRCVAMIEVVDADERYASRVIDAATYVAERLAVVLAGRLAA